jgi:hypothetical protein
MLWLYWSRYGAVLSGEIGSEIEKAANAKT